MAEREILAALGLLDAEEAREPVAAAERASAEALLAEVGLAAEPVAPRSEARARLLEATQPEARFAGVIGRVQQLLDFSEEQARALLDKIADRAEDLVGWVAGDIEGAHYYHFQPGPRVAAVDCGLVWLEPGVEFPTHRHLGSELNVTLSGRAVEGSGAVFEPGDVVVRAPNSVHDFRAIGEEPFVFVVVLGDGIEFV
jgi:quercetin dioxygenase-like cupin family protein